MSSFKNMVTTQLHFTLETGRQVAKMADPQINICSVAFVPREQQLVICYKLPNMLTMQLSEIVNT